MIGDTEEVAWPFAGALGAFISLDSGYAHDLPADLRREIVAVLEHFVEWCEVTHERANQMGGRDEEYQAASDAAFAQANARAATESRQLRQAVEGSKAQGE